MPKETKIKQKYEFPKGFLWGAATSAHQVEGNNTNSDWWQWEYSSNRIAELTARGKNVSEYQSGIADDSFNRFDEDFSLAEKLNHKAHRLSLEWSRIEPNEGEFSEAAISHYEKVLLSAKSHHLVLFVTLHHYTSPIWFMEKGGFSKKENIDFFCRYAELVARRLGKYVDFWLTINEPEMYSTLSYLTAVYPPQEKKPFKTIHVIDNVIDAHNRSAQILHDLTKKPVSLSYHLSDLQPAGLFGGIIKAFAHYFADDYILKRTIDYCDYIGVNYYFHRHIGLFGFRQHSHSHHQTTDMGWGIHPEGLERVLIYLKRFKKPIYITENGLADAKDGKREKFIKDHLYHMHRAIEQGADVRGYLYWSLLDNFEWQHGFWPRFGLIEVDRQNNLKRTIRPSATAYGEICKNNSMDY